MSALEIRAWVVSSRFSVKRRPTMIGFMIRNSTYLPYTRFDATVVVRSAHTMANVHLGAMNAQKYHRDMGLVRLSRKHFVQSVKFR